MATFDFSTPGIIQYDPPRPGMKRRTDRWAVVSIDREITRYYRDLIKRTYHVDLCEPSWNAHCSVVRGELIQRPELWKRLNKQKVSLQYNCEPLQVPGKPHFWYLKAYCPEIDEIRRDHKLRTFTEYHITIGRLYHDDYIR